MLRKLLAALVLCGAAVHAEPAPDPVPTIGMAAAKVLAPLKRAIEAKDWPEAIRTGEEARDADGLTGYERFLVERFLLVAYFSSGDHARAMIAAYNCVMSPDIPAGERKTLVRAALSLAVEANDNGRVFDIAHAHADVIAADDESSTNVATAYFNAGDKGEARLYAKRAAAIAREDGRPPSTSVLQLLQFTEGF